jgi:hypothetical protein
VDEASNAATVILVRHHSRDGTKASWGRGGPSFDGLDPRSASLVQALFTRIVRVERDLPSQLERYRRQLASVERRARARTLEQQLLGEVPTRSGCVPTADDGCRSSAGAAPRATSEATFAVHAAARDAEVDTPATSSTARALASTAGAIARAAARAAEARPRVGGATRNEGRQSAEAEQQEPPEKQGFRGVKQGEAHLLISGFCWGNTRTDLTARPGISGSES